MTEICGAAKGQLSPLHIINDKESKIKLILIDKNLK